MKPTNGMESLNQAIERLTKSGYTETLSAKANGRLEDSAHISYDAKEFSIDETVRFEGSTDLDEESAVFALRHASGLKGTFIVVFGPQIPTEQLEVVRKLS